MNYYMIVLVVMMSYICLADLKANHFAAAESFWLGRKQTQTPPQPRFKMGFLLVFAQWCGSQVGVCLYQISLLSKDGIWRCYFSIRAE